MRKRAEQVDQTRQRIVSATVELHGTVGPAETTIAAIAERAGVTRLTVYRHFPADEELFSACRSEWASAQRLPDVEGWARIEDPERRLRRGLADLYRFYRQGEQMLTRVYRDRAVLPESQQRGIAADERLFLDTLLAPFDVTGAPNRRLRAVIGHAVSFWTWRSLCVDHRLSNRDAVEAMVALVLAAGGTAWRAS